MTSQASAQQKWLIFSGVSLAGFISCVDFTIVNSALPFIQADLHTSLAQLQWVITIFIVALSSCMVIMGRLADLYGRRLLLYTGMLIFALASLGAGIAVNIQWLIGFRFLQGIACAILYTASAAVMLNAFPRQEKGKVIGMMFGINGLGLAIGPVLGGIIISALSWRWIFWVNIPIIITSLSICFSHLRESRNTTVTKKLDWCGLITLVTGLFGLVLGITQSSVYHLSSTLVLLLISVIVLIAFYNIEKRSSAPIIQFNLLANRYAISGLTATFMLAFFYCLDLFLMPLYLYHIAHQPSYLIGLILFSTPAMFAILSPLIGRVVDRFGAKILLLFGFSCFVVSALLQTHFSQHSTLGDLLTAFILMGIGWACIAGPANVLTITAVPENRAAMAIGSSGTIHNIGGTIGLALGLALYQLQSHYSLLTELGARHIIVGSWVNNIATSADGGLGLLQQYTSLSHHEAISLVQQVFISGYHAAMWLLVSSAGLALAVISMTIKHHNTQ